MNYLGRFVVYYPKIIIAVTLAATIGYAGAILTRGVEFNGAPETLARHDSTLQFFNETRKNFGDDRVIIVALTTEDVFRPDFIEKLDRLTRQLADLDGIDETQSLTNIKAIRRTGDGITIERLIEPRALDASMLARLKQEVTGDPLYAKQYISLDGRTAAINVFLKPLAEAEARAVAEKVERVAKSQAGGDEVLLAGVPVIDARGIRSMFRDMVLLSPIAAVLCFVVFLAAFRSFWGAALPMAALLIGLIWTIGLMALLDRPITLATLSLPTTLMAVGSSYIFHVLNQYRISMSMLDDHLDAEGKRTAWLDGLNFITPAVLVSGTTTMAGFGALASSPVPTARDMGIFEAIGVLIMLALTLAFIPAALSLLPPHALGRSSEKDYATWLNGPLKSMTALILFRRRAVLITTLALTFIIGAGAIWLRANTDYLRIFPSRSETVQAAEKLHERLAGAATVQLVVSGAPGAARQVEFLRAVESLEQFSLNQSGVDTAVSVADIVKRLNSAVSGSAVSGAVNQSAEAIPQDNERLRSLFDNYLSQDESLYRLVSRDYSSAIIILRTNLFGSNELSGLTRKLGEWSRSNLPGGITAQATGSVVLLNGASDAVADSQTSSLAIALVSIYLMMVILFRSFATGLLALIPNLLPIICYFGFLGWAGITLDITTSLVASAVLGLAVDNAVHMIRRYRQSVSERKRMANGQYSAEDEGWAMWLTMLRTGKPMVLANLMLMAAFLIFMLSSFVPVRVAGLLWAVTILACLAADLIFLPVLMKSKPFARQSSPGSGRNDQLSEQQNSSLEKVIK